jgi:hypothetical protein
MGRGRAKAKQTKVARELKYSSPSTDFTNLQRELSGHSPLTGHSHSSPPGDVLSDEHDSDDDSLPWDDTKDDHDDWRR